MIHISNLRGMTDRWNLFWFHLHKVLCVVLMIHLISNECLSINLEGLALLEFRSRVESDPFGALQNWNPSDDNPCKWTGVRCVDRKVITLSLKELSLHGILTLELEKLSNLRALLLCHNKFQGSTPLIENPKMHFDLMHDQNLSCVAGFGEPYLMSSIHVHVTHRGLVEETRNLHAAPGSAGSVSQLVSVPPIASSSFPARRNKSKLIPAPAPMPLPSPFVPHPETTPTEMTNSEGNDVLSSKKSATWMYILVLPMAALLLTLGTCMFLVCRSKGVSKLKGSELEAACEDFSNIVISHPEFTVYKGTLSSRVEIAVVSTTITSLNDWSRHSEMLFRKRIDALSHVNHKNFVSLLGYCEENEPFMRMMVLDYAPNGTLYEHLHVEEFEHLDWSARMRIIMGTAYCLQHMHELKPPIPHPNLLSCSIFAADIDVWKEIFANVKTHGDDDLDHSEPLSANPANDVYSFGILLLEIVSGKVPCSEEQVVQYLNGNGGVGSLVDPTLKTHKDQELETICEVIRDCFNLDPRKRPTMKEVTSKLRDVIQISPEAATFSTLVGGAGDRIC
ncbi:hypothetical protein C4D60_Mb01t00960 [Musa balbisiana]|uniref:Protein kinase domain-containing protein n=1 Tax=Musa balbisiana TaxID=52838 RepID=A0A4S8JK80_MUSBA|nr:hypothetical protein C4D60_Mb01t00960 [Musa balbisiana]